MVDIMKRFNPRAYQSVEELTEKLRIDEDHLLQTLEEKQGIVQAPAPMLAQERETGLPEQLQDHVPFKYSMCYLDLHTTASISQLSENIAEENKEKQREGEMTQEMTLKKSHTILD